MFYLIFLENIFLEYCWRLVSFRSPDDLKHSCCCWCTSQCNRWLAASCLLYFVFPEFFFHLFFFFFSFTIIKLGICDFFGHDLEKMTCLCSGSEFWLRTFVLCLLFFFLNFMSQTVTLRETVGTVPQVIHKMSLCLLFHSPSGCKAKLESCLF